MPIQTKAGILYVVSQAAVGTGVTVDQATHTPIRAIEVEMSPVGEGLIERVDHVSAYSGALQPVRGGQRWDIRIVTELYPWTDPTDITTSPLAALWAACGTLSTLGGPNRIRWAPITAYTPGAIGVGTVTPCTVELHEVGGNRYRAIDCYGTVVMRADAGARWMCEWTLHGMWSNDPIASTFTQALAAYGTAQSVPVTLRSASFTGSPAGFASAAWTPGMVLTERPAAEPSSSIARAFAPSFLSRDQPDVLAYTVDADDDTALPIWSTALGTTPASISLAWAPGSQTWTIALPAATWRVPSRQSGKAMRQYDLEAVATVQASTGDTSYLTMA